MTAHAMKGDRERCLEAGMDAYLPKPISVQELFDLIESGTYRPTITALDSDPEPAVDTCALMDRIDGDLNLLKDLVGLFVQNSRELLSEIGQAIDAEDAVTLQRYAHTLKGCIGNFAANAAYNAAFRLEQIGKEQDLANAREAYRDLENEIERLEPALHELASRKEAA
jgi:HPt (histidine-containing phosphotransfer) domain-containing protein